MNPAHASFKNKSIVLSNTYISIHTGTVDLLQVLSRLFEWPSVGREMHGFRKRNYIHQTHRKYGTEKLVIKAYVGFIFIRSYIRRKQEN
jgi:hypothetical protein